MYILNDFCQTQSHKDLTFRTDKLGGITEGSIHLGPNISHTDADR